MAGELIISDHQLELAAYLMGDGCDWDNDSQGWSDPTGGVVRFAEVDRAFTAGSVSGFDTDGPILFTAALCTPRCTDEGDAWMLVEELRSVWSASGRSDMELHMQLPGLGHCWLEGRPRGVMQSDVTLIRTGLVRALVAFSGLDGVLHLEGS